jgi:16S rRNA (guanine527-N7)-methyltransferase
VTEEEAQALLREELGVSRETFEKLDAFRARVVAESGNQNLVSAATIPHIWARHFVDSAQLLLHTQGSNDAWLDLGTGAGFPGVVIAILRPETPVIFVESRRKRIDFLAESVEILGLNNVRLEGRRLELVESVPVSVITGRAFAPLPRLFELAHRFSTEKTLWVLPKGRSATEELETARASWQGTFHVKQSITDAEAAIIVATGVRRRKQARS